MARAEIDIEDAHQRILVDASLMEKDLIQAVPGANVAPRRGGSDPLRTLWYVPRSWSACLALRGLFGPRLEVGPILADWAWSDRVNRIDPANEVRMAVEWAGGVLLEPDLYGFQDVGSEFLVRSRHALLADEMGAGKTVQTIRALRRLHAKGEESFPVCVIAPNTAKQSWANEWKRWDPEVVALVVRGSAPQRRKVIEDAWESITAGRRTALIVNYEAVRSGLSRLAPYGNVRLEEKEKAPGPLNQIPWRTVVVDEAHRMKDPRSKQTRACWAVQHGETVNFRFALTGTPIANHVGDLWSIMHGIAPDDYPTRTRWIDRYCMMAWSPFGDLEIVGVRPDTAHEFYGVLNPRMRRMPKSLVLRFLPPKIRPVRYVEMGPKQSKAYKEMKKQQATLLESGDILTATNPMVVNTRLVQFASAYAEIGEDGKVKLSEPSPKLDAMEEIIDEMDGQALVVVAQSRQLIMLAAARLDKRNVSYRLIVGGVPEQERARNIEDFQEGRAQVMLMTIAAGGVGITLTKASTIVFLQRSWSMIDNVQCEDRVHRIGSEQHEKIVVIDMIAANTVEEQQIPRLHDKAKRLQEIARDREVLWANGDVEGMQRLDQEYMSIYETPLYVPTGGDA